MSFHKKVFSKHFKSELDEVQREIVREWHNEDYKTKAFVIDMNNKAIGFCLLRQIDHDVYHNHLENPWLLSCIYVLQDYRNQGFGGKLVQNVITQGHQLSALVLEKETFTTRMDLVQLTKTSVKLHTASLRRTLTMHWTTMPATLFRCSKSVQALSPSATESAFFSGLQAL